MRNAFRTLLVATALVVASAGPARVASADLRPTLLSPVLQEEPGYVPPGANLGGPAPQKKDSITDKWWFWAGVGGIVAATVIVILVAGGEPSPPKSTLGNMDAFPDK